MKTLKDYRVSFQYGGTYIAQACSNKAEARNMTNKYLTDLCGFSGRNAGPRPRILFIDLY